MAEKRVPTIDDLRKDYPNIVPAGVIGRMLNKDAQRVRNMAKLGLFPFAVVEIGKRRSSYTFPTERFIAWMEGRLQA